MTPASFRAVPIADCGEPLVPIPRSDFAFTEPHVYVDLGAPYGDASPWMLRRGVLAALQNAQRRLGIARPGWRLKLFDAYRPVAVQAFMVWREFRQQATLRGQSLAAYDSPAELERADPALYALIAETGFTFWGVPSADPATPPPHSTGAAVDLTLVDGLGRELDMGCPIDETTERAFPDFLADATAPELRAAHGHRQLLNAVMTAAGFTRYIHEWWHFSLGDQRAAFTRGEAVAIYGRVP